MFCQEVGKRGKEPFLVHPSLKKRGRFLDPPLFKVKGFELSNHSMKLCSDDDDACDVVSQVLLSSEMKWKNKRQVFIKIREPSVNVASLVN